MLIISALNIWSMNKRSGAQSLWYTMKGYADHGWKVHFLTSNSYDPTFQSLHNNIHITCIGSKLNRLISLKHLRFFIRPFWWIYFQIGMIVYGFRI